MLTSTLSFLPLSLGKKCTYGHKCKYYHPERSAQCQRSVADELRASAKTSATSTSAKGQAGEAGLVKSHSVPNNVAMGTKRASVPKRQWDPSIRALSYGEAEDKLRHATASVVGVLLFPLPLEDPPPLPSATPRNSHRAWAGTHPT